MPAICDILFLSTLSLRRATFALWMALNLPLFLSTLSLRRATTRQCHRLSSFPHFYPRSPCGERHNVVSKTVPAGEISIHALLAESDDIGNLTIEGFFISIHALLAESDGKSTTLTRIAWISIHALLAESDHTAPRAGLTYGGGKFLSTLSLRRATWKKSPPMCFTKHFYPRSPCGERQQTQRLKVSPLSISIHALLAESDARAEHHASSQQEFLSTLSLRRATSQQPLGTTRTTYFYPRSPCGERPVFSIPPALILPFLSTLSLRRATIEAGKIDPYHSNFYPRSPCGERQLILVISPHSAPFLSTLSLRRATRLPTALRTPHHNFYPRSPCGERLKLRKCCFRRSSNFYPRSPCGERRGSAGGRSNSTPDFYPRSPCGERHLTNYHFSGVTEISIHALLAESDLD